MEFIAKFDHISLRMHHHFPYIKKQKQKRKKNLSEILRIGEGAVSLMFWHF
jgi:hypothetical protein